MDCDIEDKQEGVPDKYLPDPELFEADEVEIEGITIDDAFDSVIGESGSPLLEEALYEYVSSAEPGNLDVNSWLRGDQQCAHLTLDATVSDARAMAEKFQAYTEAIDEIILAEELDRQMILYKGMRRDQLRYLSDSEIYVPEFISTTDELDVAREFACWDEYATADEPNVVLKITVEVGQYAFYVYINERESEYLLPRGSTIIIEHRDQLEPHKWQLQCRIRI